MLKNRNSVVFLGLLLAGCGAAVCQPDRCDEGLVCGFEGRCEAPPAVAEEPEIVDADEEERPIERMGRARLVHWGVGQGLGQDEVRVGGEAGGETLYLAFELPVDAESATLELRPSEDPTFGGPIRVDVRPVSAFETIQSGRLPGLRPGGVSRRSVAQAVLRFEVASLAQGGMLYLAVSGQGPGTGFRIATPGATRHTLHPRVTYQQPPSE